jgi:hypothetical protein
MKITIKILRIKCTKTFLKHEMFIFKILKCHNFHNFLSFIIHFTFKYSNFHMDFWTDHMFSEYLESNIPILLIKSTMDNYSTYNLIIIILTRILVSVNCGLFKMSKMCDLTMF